MRDLVILDAKVETMFGTRIFALPLFGIALAVALPSFAAGPSEGSWSVRILPAGTVTSSSGAFQCPDSVVTLKVKDGVISGSFERIADGSVIDGYDRNSSALTGTVDPNGNVRAVWQNWNIKGQITGNKLSLSWHDECGLRYANGRPD